MHLIPGPSSAGRATSSECLSRDVRCSLTTTSLGAAAIQRWDGNRSEVKAMARREERRLARSRTPPSPRAHLPVALGEVSVARRPYSTCNEPTPAPTPRLVSGEDPPPGIPMFQPAKASIRLYRCRSGRLRPLRSVAGTRAKEDASGAIGIDVVVLAAALRCFSRGFPYRSGTLGKVPFVAYA